MTRFPNYLEASSGEEINARVGAFVPLEFVFEILNNGDEIPAEKLEGARGPVDTNLLYSALEEIAGHEAWDFHCYTDGTFGFTAESEGKFCMARLIKAEGGCSQTTVLIKRNKYQEFPDWFLFIDAKPDEIRVECSKFDPYTRGIPEHDGSRFTFPPIPSDWDIEES